MKKIILLLASVLIAGVSYAQPGPQGRGEGPHADRPGPHQMQRPHHKKKVWIKAHRQNGHFVKGHYVWR